MNANTGESGIVRSGDGAHWAKADLGFSPESPLSSTEQGRCLDVPTRRWTALGWGPIGSQQTIGNCIVPVGTKVKNEWESCKVVRPGARRWVFGGRHQQSIEKAG